MSEKKNFQTLMAPEDVTRPKVVGFTPNLAEILKTMIAILGKSFRVNNCRSKRARTLDIRKKMSEMTKTRRK